MGEQQPQTENNHAGLRHQLQHRGEDLHPARGTCAEQIDADKHPQQRQCDEARQAGSVCEPGEEDREIAHQCDGDRGVRYPYRDPVAPHHDERSPLAEGALGVAEGPSSPGKARARPAKQIARNAQPTTVTSQPLNALRPYGASVAGMAKIPTPMMLPTTSAVHIQKPRLRLLSWAAASAARLTAPPALR